MRCGSTDRSGPTVAPLRPGVAVGLQRPRAVHRPPVPARRTHLQCRPRRAHPPATRETLRTGAACCHGRRKGIGLIGSGAVFCHGRQEGSGKQRGPGRCGRALVLVPSGGEYGLAAQLGDGVPFDLADPLGGDAPDRTDVGQLGLAAVDAGRSATGRRRRTARPAGPAEPPAGRAPRRRGRPRPDRASVSRAIRSPSAVSPSSSTGASRLTWSRPYRIRSMHPLRCPSRARSAISVDLGVAAQPALQGAPDSADLVDLLGHVHREPDDPALLRDAAGDRLADPPGARTWRT